jgi:hypothetical protein
VVFGGGPSADELLVLDPAGAGKHDEPPASWRALGNLAHVTWLRLPAMDTPVATAREKLAELAASGRRLHLLAAGEAVPLAELLALEHPRSLTSMLLVDSPPEPTGGPASDGAAVTDSATVTGQAPPVHGSAPARQELTRHGVAVHVLTYRDAERADRGAPLPLGHPQVVVALRRQLSGRRRRLRWPAKRRRVTI